MLVEFAFLAATFTTFAVGYLAHRFLATLAVEAPGIHAELGAPTLGHYIRNDRPIVDLARMILSRQYRTRLVEHPKSRAWASWLFLAHWLHVVALLWLLAAMVLH